MGEQLKQAERNQQAAVRDSRADRSVDLLLRNAEPSLADAITKCHRGDEDVSDAQIQQFMCYVTAWLLNSEQIFDQYKQGLLPEASLVGGMKGTRAVLSSPGGRAAFLRMRAFFGDAFVAYVDNVLADTPVNGTANPGNLSGTFRDDVAAQLARLA